MSFNFRLILSLMVISAAVLTAGAEPRVEYESAADSQGLLMTRAITPGYPGLPSNEEPVEGNNLDQEVIFTVDDAGAIARNIAICGVQREFLTGWYLNSERTTYYPVEGTGAYNWEYPMSSDFYIPVAASDNGMVLASTPDINPLCVWLSGAGPTPSWQYSYPTGFKGKDCDVSDDGTYVISTAKHESLDDGKLFVFNANSNVPIWEVDFNAQAGIYGLEMSEDNNWIVVSTYHNFYIYDLQTRTLFQTIGGYGQIKAGIDDDAEWFAIGDFNGIVTVYRRVGTLYSAQWTNSMGGWITALDISQDASTVLAGNMFFNPYRGIARAFNINGDTLWTYDQYGDYVSSVSLSNDGSVGVAGSWGQLDYTFGDVFTAFEMSSGRVIFRLLDDIDEPGTIFCTSISDDGCFAVCGGKMVHARTMGRGGQVYSIRLQTPPTLVVTLTPQNPPVQVPAGGGSFGFTAQIENRSGNPINFDAWIMAVLPNGNVYGPIILRQGLPIGAGAVITRQLSQAVPGYAPSGSYQYVGNVGVYPDSLTASDSFPFTKLAGEGAPAHNLGWACYGWDDDKTMCAADSPQSAAFSDKTDDCRRVRGLCDTFSASPNPFNATTAISFELRDAGFVTLAVYDIAGREAAVLVDGYLPAGYHQAVFEAGDLASGVYFARLTAGDFVQTRKMLLLK